MGSGEVSPQPGPRARVEVLHASARVRVTRQFLPGLTVVRKQPLGPDARQRLRHELAMLDRLRGVDGVAQLEDTPRYPASIVLRDAGDTTLSSAVKPLAVDELIGLALRLARAVAGMHRRGVIHRDVAPANVVIARDGAPCLVDFAHATSFAEIHTEFTHHTHIIGTLAYLAPEQTGRTGRSVDQRADLYALGATLYEMATGEPPFGAGDPLRLTHDHLARTPVPPAETNRDVPEPLSAIIMHLLEKEPDNRYQTADGLAYDLERLRDARRSPEAGPLRIGEHDVPLRLAPPSRLVGRDEEVAALTAAFEASLAGRCRAVLVSGAPGVGKTALVDQLKPVVTGRDGWFVAGKFDQDRRDLEFDAVYQAFRALGRLLLAEPEQALVEARGSILAALGPNAGLLAATVPEFAALLGVPPDPGDPLTRQFRVPRAAVDALGAVASPKRPVVVVLDDLQWAGGTPLGFVDLMLAEPVDGLLLVATYRGDDVAGTHPLAAPLSRWRSQPGVRHLRLDNLPTPVLVTLVAEMLHVPATAAAGLAEASEPHTSGNPYETVELLNALRRDGMLTATAAGWRWDDAAVRTRLGRSEAAGLPAARLAALPAPSRDMVEAMACLGGRVECSVLRTATGAPARAVEQRLGPALEDGLLVMEPGSHEAVRFSHDRIREATLRGLDPQRRRALGLSMARRLAAVPELFAVAAQQYLPAADAVQDAAERREVVGLLRRAANQAALIGDYALVNALLTTALPLIDPSETATLIEVRVGHHAALYGLGCLEEADEEYHRIERLPATAPDRVDATCVQVSSLTHRKRFAEAIGLGVECLRELGVAVPAADRLPAELDRQFEYLYRWLDQTDAAQDIALPDLADPTLRAVTRVIIAILPAGYFATDIAVPAWLSLEALRIWLDHGPSRSLLGPATHAAFAALPLRGDESTAYRALRRSLTLSEAYGYEPDTSQARYLFAVLSWCFEPIENSVQTFEQAREGLIACGDLANAGYTYPPTVACLVDSAATLNAYAETVQAGLAFVRRTGSEQTAESLDSFRWLADVLRGESSATAEEAAALDRYADSPLASFLAHLTRAIAATIFGDLAGSARHTAQAMALLPAARGAYPTAMARVLRALALAGQARDLNPNEREGPLSELDDLTRWVAERAADAPANFLHLLRLLEAERAWTAGDFRAAVLAFDAARRDATRCHRPWHRALITERAARFHLAHGLQQAGYDLLARARQEYLAWGATGKVDHLDWAHPVLRPPSDMAPGPDPNQPGAPHPDRATVTTGTIDLLGILSTSQALSSQTSIERLHARVVEVLSAMTGATAVHLLLRGDDGHDWLPPSPDGTGGSGSADGTGYAPAVPESVLRYTQRMPEPLVIDDATRDDRFARDPYFADLACCSLLVVPILSRGTLRALLLLENRLIRGAFTAERLDAVTLIAGQLAVSLDNAKLYAAFRRIAAEQAALRRVATRVARGEVPEQVFAAVAEEVGKLFDTGLAEIVRFEPDGQTTVLGGHGFTPVEPAAGGTPQPGPPLPLDEAADHTAGLDAAGFHAAVDVPIVVGGRVWGAMCVGSRRERLPSDTEQRLAEFTELVATAIANAENQAELTASRARIVAAADETRRRIERDLHDGAQQRLVSLALRLRTAQKAAPPPLAAQLDQAVVEASAALDELREIARGIHPAILTEGGLRPALRALARRSPVPVDLDLHTEERLPEQVEVSAYYIVAEALTNAAKHAHASAITVTVDTRASGSVLQIAVRDDGIGGADFVRGSGLVGIKDRAAALGGRVLLHSPCGAGTSLRVELPLTVAHGAALPTTPKRDDATGRWVRGARPPAPGRAPG